LFYVALTRAKEQVYLSWAGQRYKWGKLEFCQPSPFIGEIDKAFLESQESTTSPFTRSEPARSGFNREFRPSGITDPSPKLKMSFDRKITQLREERSEPGGFEGDDPSGIVSGMNVEHQRFGKGKVLQIEGTSPDLKATVFFHNAGQRQLLLRFAKLKIIP